MGLVFGKPIQYSGEFEETLSSIQTKEERMLKYGITPPEPEKKRGTLSKIFALLRMGETAPAAMAYLKGESPTSAYIKTFTEPFKKEEGKMILYSDVLDELGWTPENKLEKFVRGGVGLGLDILLDPKTFLTFGALGATKLFVKGKGVVSLNKPGTNLLKKAINQFGDESGRKMTATHVGKTGEKYLAKTGLKFMGAEILPRKVVTAPFKGTDWLLDRIPVSGKIYKGFKSWGVNSFTPWKKVEKLPGGIGIEYHDVVTAFYKGGRFEQEKVIDKWTTHLRATQKATGKMDIGDDMLGWIERGGRVTGNSFLDNLTRDMIRTNQKIIKTDRAVGYDVGEIENYMRHYLTKAGKKYLNLIKTTKPAIKATISVTTKKPGAMLRRNIFGTVKDINKELAPDMARAGIKGKFFEENAFKLMAIRESEHIKAIKTADFWQEVAERFALKPSQLKPQRLAEMMGEKVIWQDGVRYVDAGVNVPQLKGLFVPEEIRTHLKDVHAVITGADEPAKQFLRVYDKALSWWKLSVTGWFPAFHSRNFIGASWNNFLRGVKNPQYYKWTQSLLTNPDDTTTVFGKTYKNSNLLERIGKEGIFNQTGMMDVGRTLEDRIAAMGAAGQLEKLKTYYKTPPIKMMNFVENRVRIPLFLYRLDKGDSFAEAAKVVMKTHFDYMPEGLSTFERNVMKRIIPFYTWTRHNVPLQFEMLLKQPGKYAGLDKLRREVESVAGTEKVKEERKYMPTWMKEMFTIRLPWVKNTGEPYYLQMDLPVEDLNKLSVREIFSMLSPVLRYPIDRIANKYVYFDAPIYDKNIPRQYQTAKTMTILKNLPEPIKKFLSIQEIKKKNFYTGEFEPTVVMDARNLHFIRSLWFSRIYSSLMNLEAPDQTIEEKITRLLLGEPLRPLDIKEAKWRDLKNKDVYLRDVLYYLLRTGEIPYKEAEKEKKGLIY